MAVAAVVEPAEEMEATAMVVVAEVAAEEAVAPVMPEVAVVREIAELSHKIKNTRL